MRSSVCLMVFAILAICVCSLGSPAGYAQTCYEPSPLCDPWWNGSKYVNNPDCFYSPTASFVLSNIPAPNPSEGYRINPGGTPCGATKSFIPVPCGLTTSNNTCAESAIGTEVHRTQRSGRGARGVLRAT